jgi:phospholipase C
MVTAGCGSIGSPRPFGGGATPPPPTFPISHIVVIVQENRSTDNLFHGLPGADIADSGLDSHGRRITLHPVPLANDYDMGHEHSQFVVEYDGGKMDGFDQVMVSCKTPSCPTDAAYAYVKPASVAPYFQMAEQYTFADRMFQTNQGPSFPAHQYLIAGTSEPSVGSDLLAAENPRFNGGDGVGGCDAPSGTIVEMIDPSGNESSVMPPCFDHPTVIDLLDARHVSWRYYAPGTSSIWTGPNSIRHLRFGADWANVIIPQTGVLDDIANGRLANVSWVIPDALTSDHPALTDGTGPAWVASVVNAIGTSGYWNNTAIFITWDDWGGWYDHVPPPAIFNSNELGMRVPLIVVSPYAKTAYVSHVDHEFGSLLKFIEEDYGLGSLGFSDSRSDDFADCFNFMQTPQPFHRIAASKNAQYFLRPGAPHGAPDDQ